MKFRICVLTTSRADFGIYRPVVDALNAHDDIDVGLFVTGQHLRHDMGYSIQEIEKLGYPIWGQADISIVSDNPADAARSMGRCIDAVADFIDNQPSIDLFLALGDRYEMLAAVAAIQPFVIPVAHLHGGEETEGAFDNSMRHAITKLSHLHFASTDLARKRILAMGETPDKVIVSGAPALDAVVNRPMLTMNELQERFPLPDQPFIIATFHPETLNLSHGTVIETALAQLDSLVEAMRRFEKLVVFTSANIDPGGVAANEVLRKLALHDQTQFFFVENFGAEAYFSVLRLADMMVGNSSSGILEAASFNLPVVNLGNRQTGREISDNVVQADFTADSIFQAMQKADSPAFRKRMRNIKNIYGDGQASKRIVAGMHEFLNNSPDLTKSFHLIK